ncbi:hypothetical protein BpHYR1_035143 [Brachionus plicatilis]|uniref:Uncharacterized protein n=1 Tax=Brachionus plicatilis TaxID=10195 RepID=A0A3M7SE07_BRAPC|nr:hypothetical protein BpHYR1_035143 [Brachionus plicatilis]
MNSIFFQTGMRNNASQLLFLFIIRLIQKYLKNPISIKALHFVCHFQFAYNIDTLVRYSLTSFEIDNLLFSLIQDKVILSGEKELAANENRDFLLKHEKICSTTILYSNSLGKKQIALSLMNFATKLFYLALFLI